MAAARAASRDAEFQLDIEGLRLLGETMQDAINELAENITRDAYADSPVKTGNLQSSIGTKKDYGKLVALVIADSLHAGRVHNGTSSGPNHPFTTKANPFVRKAAQKNFEHIRPRGD